MQEYCLNCMMNTFHSLSKNRLFKYCAECDIITDNKKLELNDESEEIKIFSK